MIRYVWAMLLLIGMTGYGDSVASARQRTQKVIYPNGRVVYEPVQAAADQAAAQPADKAETAVDVPTPQPVTLAQNATGGDAKPPCAPCGPGTPDHPTGECKKENIPIIVPGSDADCDGSKNCVDKNNPQIGYLSVIPGITIPFYKCCKDFHGRADIPVIVKNVREEYIFGKQRYGEKCCEYDVCVVTKCCCIDTKKCELRNKEVTLRACIRQNGNVDVYVINEPGFPAAWVLYLDLPLNEYKAKFPHGPVCAP